MQEILLDSNIILRLFDISEPSQTAKSKRLFEEAAAGKTTLVIVPPILFEVAWVLRCALKRANGEVLDILDALVSWPGVKVADRERVQQALRLGKERGVGFADSYLAAEAASRGLPIATFNVRHFARLGAPIRPLA
ncbi:hypothetical protein FACS1894186_8270 [Alphaproteobacteria bacterium]|nr:hypothetical protein FACS1894186_8270 [Alphaproteobacteria bacterium]